MTEISLLKTNIFGLFEKHLIYHEYLLEHVVIYYPHLYISKEHGYLIMTFFFTVSKCRHRILLNTGHHRIVIRVGV